MAKLDRIGALEERVAKLEDRWIEVVKWQYKAIGFVTAYSVAISIAQILIPIVLPLLKK